MNTNIKEFKETGITVFEDVFSPEEVLSMRESLHGQLLQIGVDHEKVLSREHEFTDGFRLKSGVSKIFYPKWKMDIHMHPKVVKLITELTKETFVTNSGHFTHPFGYFDHEKSLTYIDRLCWRLPDVIQEEGGLGIHLDRNPFDPYTHITKWRPIQAFVALTDHYGSESGGLRVVKGQHKIIDDFYKDMENLHPKGEFYRFNTGLFEKECQPIYVPSGSLVCWDNRLPHATCKKLSGYDTREVIYTGFLPNVKLNRDYVRKQLVNLKNNKEPDYADPNCDCDKDWLENDLTELQRSMLGYNLEKK
jgi:hypothetical protein